MLSRSRSICFALFAASALACQQGDDGGGGFDPRIDPHFEAIPDPPTPLEVDRTESINRYFDGGYDCTVWERTYSHGNESYPMLEDQADVIYPGADLQGSSLAQSVPAPITARRGPGAIVINNKNGSAVSGMTIDEVSLLEVTRAENAILNAQPDEFPADLTIHIARVRSEEELQIQLEAGASFFDLFSARSGFQLRDDERVSSFLVTLQQNFYSIAFERPAEPHEFYADGTRLEDVMDDVQDGNPAGYVSNVTYGRVFYLLVQATESALEMETTLTANFLMDVLGADIGGSVGYISELEDLSIQAYAYGGDQQAVLESIFAGLESLTSFKQQLIAANDITSGKPISFKVRSVATDRLLKNGLSVAYDYVDCTETTSCVPTPVSPHAGATLDNGCRNDANRLTWDFDWGDCDGADAYEIEIRHPDFGLFRAAEVIDSRYGLQLDSAFLPSRHWSGWTWRVRARTFGAWRPWTPENRFALEPADSDCDTYVELFADANYGGRRLVLRVDPANPELVITFENLQDRNFEDILSSLKLHNLSKVIVYDRRDLTGRQYEFDHDCPDIARHSSHGFWHDIVSSVRLYR